MRQKFLDRSLGAIQKVMDRESQAISDKGNRRVESILLLKETCRLRAVSSYEVLVDAVSSFFHGQAPDLAWLQ